jgi:hypothetical protein
MEEKLPENWIEPSSKLKWTPSGNEETQNTQPNLDPVEELPPFPPQQLDNNFFPEEEQTPTSPPLPLSSYLGEVNKFQISNHLYHFNIDNSQTVKDLKNLNLVVLNDDCKFDFNPEQNTSLGKVIENIVKVSSQKQLKIKECFLYKVPNNHSILNIFESKTKYSFIYILQSNNEGGDIILDLSSIGGPSIPLKNPPEGILNILPGWIPYKVSKNNSNKELIFIAGTLN